MKTKSNDELDKYKKEWLQQKWNKIMKARTKTTEWCKVDVETGKYMTLLRIAHKEGGAQFAEARRAATTYANKCLAMK